MKKLSQFSKFDLERFLNGKTLEVISCSAWNDFTSKKHLGTKVETVITKDNTVYDQKDGEVVTNRYEKLVLKIKKDVTVPLDANVLPVNATATVYGEYRNQLSVTADDIKVVQPQKEV